jgi:hypothetical protein
MAGSKKFKSRTSQQTTEEGSSAIISDSDQSLVNDLLTQLDSRDHVVQAESASILETMHLDEKADIMESLLKQDSKSRFKTRQVTFHRFLVIRAVLKIIMLIGPEGSSACPVIQR